MMVSRTLRIAFTLLVLSGLLGLSARPSQAQGLKAQIMTDRGCGTGAVYAVGDVLSVIFEIDGDFQQALATIEGVFPNGQSVVLFQATVPANRSILQPIAIIGGTLGMRSVRLTASALGGRLTGTASCTFYAASASITATIMTDRGCTETGSHPSYTVGERAQILFRIDGTPQAQALIQEVTADGQTLTLLQQVVPGNETLALPHDITGAAGARQVRLTASAASGGASTKAACSFVVAGAPVKIQRLLAVGDPVPAMGQLGMFDTDPLDQDQNVSAIRRAADDGSVFVADYAGSALLHVAGGGAQVAIAPNHAASRSVLSLQSSGNPSQILLDTTAVDPVDKVGIARILRVETGRDGTSGIAALRADNNRGIYRLSGSAFSRLALVPGPTGPVELAVGDAGQIAYVAPTATGAQALFQMSAPAGSTAGRTAQLLTGGQAAVNGLPIVGFTSLTSDAAGDLAFQVTLGTSNGTTGQALVRKTQNGFAVVAVSGQRVARGLGSSAGPLLRMLQPRIGPDGTVVFLGTGDGFSNFYIEGPNRPLQPLLPGSTWNTDPATSDYELAADGTVALRAESGASVAPALFLVLPSGAVMNIPPGDQLLPTGHPVFGPDGTGKLLFFLAQNLARPKDRNGHIPVVLCRSRLVNGSPVVDAVAAPGQPVPGKPGLQLLTITQRPVVSAGAVTFGALFGGNDASPVPSAGLFRVPLGGTLADAVLLAQEGSDLPNANHVAILRSLSYTTGGALHFGALLPGAGGIVATVTPPQAASTAAAHTASVARIQATSTTVAPLLAIGQPLDRPDRLLLAVLGRFVALGANQQLLVARFSRADGSVGEGLFTVAQNGQVSAVAVTGDPAPGIAGTSYSAFSDTAAYTLNPPAVSTDGNVVFKAKLDQGGTPTFGVFQWNGATVTGVGLANPNPDNLALTPDDQPPYTFDRWSAGPGGSAYLMEQHLTRSSTQVTRLFERFSTGLAPLVVPGITPVTGGTASPLANLLDYVLDSSGGVFVQGAASNVPGVLSLGVGGLTPLVRQGQSIPTPADGTSVQGLVFDGSFSLMPDSAHGVLLFRAGVTPQGTPATGRQGLFRLGSHGIETVMVEQLAVNGSRDLSYGTLATTPDRQTLNGTSAFATFGSGRWSIFRWRAGVTTLVAQEGGALPGGAKIVSLDPGPVLDLPAGSGPVFTLSETGDVAFLATDGTRWGIFLFSDTGP